MAAAAADRSAAAQLSIGQVLAKLTPDFPGLTSSKLRYLEEQGIVTPRRTAAGYRKFSPDDLERLRLGLVLQRDHYLPLSVIREHLDETEAAGGTLTPPPSIHPAVRSLTRADLLAAAGAAPQLLNDAISIGLIRAAETYRDRDVALMRALVALDRHGIEPRHLRAVKQSAERDADLVDKALTPLLRRADARSRAKANELGPELAARLDDVRGIFVTEALESLLP
jgi:DNA-binding transcriptional MerR regulator